MFVSHNVIINDIISRTLITTGRSQKRERERDCSRGRHTKRAQGLRSIRSEHASHFPQGAPQLRKTHGMLSLPRSAERARMTQCVSSMRRGGRGGFMYASGQQIDQVNSSETTLHAAHALDSTPGCQGVRNRWAAAQYPISASCLACCVRPASAHSTHTNIGHLLPLERRSVLIMSGRQSSHRIVYIALWTCWPCQKHQRCMEPLCSFSVDDLVLWRVNRHFRGCAFADKVNPSFIGPQYSFRKQS